MKTLAILHPTQLVGQELREALEHHRDAWQELRLLTTQAAEAGTLTEVRGEAAMVTRYEPGALEGVDLTFFCGPWADNTEPLADLSPAARGIVLSPDAGAEAGPPVVAGINDDPLPDVPLLSSPHPAVVLLAHLLAPLGSLGLLEANATLLKPASALAPTALDELLEQTRSLLSFRPLTTDGALDRQFVFNPHPSEETATVLLAQLRHVLGMSEVALGAETVNAGVFHSFAASVHVRLQAAATLEAVRAALGANPRIELDEAERPGPVRAAGADRVVVGALRPHPTAPDRFWLWGLMDNLTVGGASNAIQIFRQTG